MIPQSSNSQLLELQSDFQSDAKTWEELLMRLDNSEEFQEWLEEDGDEF